MVCRAVLVMVVVRSLSAHVDINSARLNMWAAWGTVVAEAHSAGRDGLNRQRSNEQTQNDELKKSIHSISIHIRKRRPIFHREMIRPRT